MAEVMDGYIRVSQVAGRSGERFQSPTAQRDSIKGWAQAHGVKIGRWHEDLDRSGGTMDRPGMNAALARIEAGASSGLIVARLDRFARTVVGGLTTIQQLHERGARVVSVAESIDPATPIGRAMLGLLLIMGEWQRDQAIEHLASAQERAVAAGRFPGRPAFGYLRDTNGATVVDADHARAVHNIFAWRASGVGWRLIAERLTDSGLVTPGGHTRWAPSTVQGIVRSEAYLGTFVGPNGIRVESAWAPLVDADLWHAANDVRGVRDNERRHHDRLLAGIARCAECRLVLRRTVNPEGFVSYACTTRGCQRRGSIGAHLLDSHVTELIDQRLARLRVSAEVEDDDAGEGRRLLAARDAAVRELVKWRDDTEAREALGERDYREGLLTRARGRDNAEADLADYKARRSIHTLDQLPGDVQPRLDDLPWDVRRQVAEALLHSVWMRPSQARGINARRHVDRRLRVVWRDDRDRPELPTSKGADLSPVRW